MRIDSAQFPLVWMYSNENDPAGAFHAFDALLARQLPCVMISREGDARHEHAPQERKQVALWLKRNKPALRAYVKGVVQVEPNAHRRLAIRAFMIMLSKAWGCPMFVAESEPAALFMAQKLLAGETLAALTD